MHVKNKSLIVLLAGSLALAAISKNEAQEQASSEAIMSNLEGRADYIGIADQIMSDEGNGKTRIRITSREGVTSGFITFDILYEAEIFQLTEEGSRTITITPNFAIVIEHKYSILKADCSPKIPIPRTCYLEPSYSKNTVKGDYTHAMERLADLEYFVKKGLKPKVYAPAIR